MVTKQETHYNEVSTVLTTFMAQTYLYGSTGMSQVRQTLGKLCDF